MDFTDFQILCCGSGCLQSEYEDSNNLVYLRARYYNDETGTFLSLDPAEGSLNDPMSLNGYSYAHDNPINRTDPSGLFPIGGIELAALLNSALCMDQSQLLQLQAVDCSCHGILAFLCPSGLFPPCSTSEPQFITNMPPPLFPTNTPVPTSTAVPTLTPTPTATPVSDLRREALTLAAFSEAGGLTDADRQVVLFTIFNREKFPNSYAPIEQALGGSQIAGGVLSGFTGDRATQINNAYQQYSTETQYAPAFQNAQTSVTNFLASPPADFTQGALQFSHAASPADAQQIVAQINHCGQSVIEGIIRSAGVNPIVNGPSMHADSVNRSAYINMNYTMPVAPSGAPKCP